MRKILFSLVLIFGYFISMSQTNNFYKKGTFGLYSDLPFGGFGGGSYSLSVNVRPSLFLTNKINFGIDFGGTFTSGNYYSVFHIKPSFKYYLLDKRFSPVFSAGYKLEFVSIDNSKTFIYNPNIGLGVSFINNPGSFTVEAGMDYDIRTGTENSKLNPYISFGFLINRKLKKENPVY